MAQHIPVSCFSDNKAIAKIVTGIRKQRYFKTSMRYAEVDKNVYQTHRNVPQSIVCGGKATFEVHTDNNGVISDIYLVA